MNLTRQVKGLAADVLDRMVPVKPVNRSPEELNRLERASRKMHLYFCRSCSSSIEIKRYCEKLGLRVVEKDVDRVNAYRNELVHGGGVPRVPCLRVEDGEQGRWLYSRDTILAYLKQRF
ncbi:glutaredoxin family protein [Bacterioplanoides pacificum]|uniref:Glutaredoxin family protein n=1 Tax=Bacterioplanoides pacificum TaxID=1171596 RepID=A0ABV7VR97_9GAMM